IAPNGLYTASEAIRKLRLPATTFHSYVKSGKIKKVVPPGRTEGYYEKAYIDEMAKASELFMVQYASEPATFSVATREDAQGIYNVIASLWGTLHTTPVETRLTWYEVNPEIDYVVKQEGIVTGYVTIMPMKQEPLQKLMRGQIRGWDIKPDDILPFTPGTPLECYTGAAVRSGVYKPEKYGMRLLAGVLDRLNGYAQKGIFIKRLYAVSDTPDGVKLCRDLGFKEEPPAQGSTFNQFILDSEESTSPFIEEYLKNLRNATIK
ncbi:MAG TPA: hypothetical protein VGD98_08620, partial [Ktedonobacteraceae bacterium]